MPFNLSEILTADSAERYSLSIRLSSDGLSFVCHSKEIDDSFRYGKVDFDSSKSFVTALKDFFFENEWLSYPYKHISVLQVTNQYILTPQSYYDEKKNKELLQYAFSKPVSLPLANQINGMEAYMVFGMEEEVYEFCSRSLLNPKFYHHLSPVLSYWNKHYRISLNSEMFVFVHPGMIDIIHYEDCKITFANSFLYEQSSDAVYYILYVWKQLGLDQQKDRLQFIGEDILIAPLEETIKKYVRFVSIQDMPTEALLLGGEVLKSSFDLICLSLCAL